MSWKQVLNSFLKDSFPSSESSPAARQRHSRPLDWNPCFRFAPFTHFPKEPGSSRCLILPLKCCLSALGSSPKEIAIKSGSDLFQLWDLDQYSHHTNLLKFVFCLFCLFFILFYFCQRNCQVRTVFSSKVGLLAFSSKTKSRDYRRPKLSFSIIFSLCIIT